MSKEDLEEIAEHWDIGIQERVKLECACCEKSMLLDSYYTPVWLDCCGEIEHICQDCYKEIIDYKEKEGIE